MQPSYPTPVGANPTGAPIQPGQNLDNPTNSPQTPVTVPTSAPVVPTSASNTPAVTPTSTPTAVVSSGPAENQVNNTIVPAMTQAQQDMLNQQSAKAAADQNAAALQAKNTTTPTPSTPPTPEETIANTPDTGNQWVYDAQGNRTQTPIGTVLPQGYSTTNPVAGPNMPVVTSVTDPTGNQLVQYSDGTYGKLNATGQYIGSANPQDFQTAQMGSDTLSKLNQAAQGNFPLSSSQQSQIDSVKSSYQNLIDTLTKLTTQNQGVMGNLSNLYGGGVSMSELSELSGVVSEGMVRIAQAQTDMAKAVSDMTTAFNNDNYTHLKDAYDEYTTQAKNVQDNINTIEDRAQKASEDFRTAVQDQLTQQLNSDKFTYQQKQDAIANAHEQGVLTETQRHDMADELTARETASKGTYQLKVNPDGTESIFSTVTGQIIGAPTNEVANGIVEPGNTGIPLLDAPGNTKTTSSGISYVDGSNMSSAEQKAANLDAVRMGMTFLPKANADIINNVQSARDSLSSIQSMLQGVNPSNGFSALFVNPLHGAEKLTHIGPLEGTLNSYDSWKDSMLTYIKAIAGPGTAGTRGNQLVQQMQQNIPSPTDTNADVAAKISTMNTLLDNAEKGIFGEKVWNTAHPDQATSYNGVTLPGASTSSTSSGGSTYNGITLPN